MATKVAAPELSDQALAELVALVRDVDSVEFKLTVPLGDRSRAGEALGVDPLDGQIRQVFFFDTPDLALNQSGLVVRARRVQRRGDDSVVKLRPVAPAELPAEVRLSANFGRTVGSAIGIDWAVAPFEVEQFRMGMDVELEHGLRDPATDVTGSDPVVTGKIALAHLNEFSDYYTRLERMEEEAQQTAQAAD
jgi:hypothetical protein